MTSKRHPAPYDAETAEKENDMDTQQLDRAFNEALNMDGETEQQRFHRTVSVSNVKHWYAMTGNFYPAMDAKQREIFNECEQEALAFGIEK